MTTNRPQDPDESLTEAERLYQEFLRCVAQGEDLGIEQFSRLEENHSEGPKREKRR